MQLPQSLREALVNDLEEFLSNLPDEPDSEMVATYIIEQLEVFADENAMDDIVVQLEESGELEGSLQDTLEEEMGSDDFSYTEEECVSLLERVTQIEWTDDAEFGDEDEDDDDDDLDDEV